MALKSADVVYLYANPVPCGFPSPADDYIETPLDLNEKLIQKPAATFFVRAKGESMAPTIMPGDLLVIDRSKEAVHGSIILAVINGEFTVKRLLKRQKRVYLKPDNENHSEIEVTDNSDFMVWGVVAHTIRSF